MRNDGVTFKVHAPRAKGISIVGSFNRWKRDQYMLTGPDERGWWSITLPLQQGRHEYLFLVDGKDWFTDPHAQALIDDGFGARNCLIIVGK